MRTISAPELSAIAVRLFDAAGSPHDESEWVAEVLIRANLMGHDSHGAIRIPQYVKSVQSGLTRPGAPIETLRETRATAVLVAHQGWGPVVARKAMMLAIEKARQCGIGMVGVRGCQHVGRVGEYPTMAVAEQMIGMAFVNSFGNRGGTVVPFGGLDGRLSPNPLAFAAPSGEPWPVLVDITSSVVPEGKVRNARYHGVQMPPGCLIDADGKPTTDPWVIYREPRGAILPLGGIVGHKGTGLAAIIELLGGALSGAGCAGRKQDVSGNGVLFQAINIADFQPVDEFVAEVRQLIAWAKSARPAPGVAEVLFPGEPEYRSAQRRATEGIPVDDSLWDEIQAVASGLGVTM